MDVKRLIKHLSSPPWAVRRVLNPAAMRELQEAIRAGETTHRGELRVAVEAALDLASLWQGQTAHQRALDVFSSLRIWDTAENNGVLIYLLLADHRVEIIADRGLLAHAGPETWDAICRTMEAAFRRHDFKGGLLEGLRAISALLARAYPAQGQNPNELPDAPVILR